ncbi:MULTISPECIES: RNA polymerase sigma factor [unclassified Parafrankia]|uniref:RNA polymerase sigma factor n=1 Tax=unclassified Parafrankia TaxID=2994368 RepID=UPI000DA4968D|nr:MULTISPECIES: RNA polymerase sigma factor [unclassified Parafrankia]SQD98237.1 RNA polymerase, sigma-24 subunit, ECF subfamily [Parafrankia sp. Ea1.12]
MRHDGDPDRRRPARAVLREPEVFADLFERHGDRVHRYLARRAGPDLAEDLVSDTFVAAFEQRSRFDPARGPDGALPWLLGIATRILQGHRRAEARRWRVLERALPDRPEPAAADRVADRVDANATVQSLVRALAELPDGERDALLLLAWGDLRYEEIATALAVPVGTVRSRIHRARNRLRATLAADPLAARSAPTRSDFRPFLESEPS